MGKAALKEREKLNRLLRCKMTYKKKTKAREKEYD